MDKAVMISIQPKWCELIASGRKTIEVRKNRPFIETPFKCYIYCTKEPARRSEVLLVSSDGKQVAINDYRNAFNGDIDGRVDWNFGNGKVIGEFVCDRIDTYSYEEHIELPIPAYEGDDTCIDAGAGYWVTHYQLDAACLLPQEFENYGAGKTLYGWHISDLKIYDVSKKLRKFRKCAYPKQKCLNEKCEYWGYYGCRNVANRPPQSWYYVNEV